MNANSLLASVLVGSIGMGLFIYGRRQRRAPHLAIGIVLMVFPYLVPSVTLMFVIAAALVGLLWLSSYLGI